MGGDYRAFGSLDGATLRVAATMMAKRDLIDQRRLLTVTFNDRPSGDASDASAVYGMR